MIKGLIQGFMALTVLWAAVVILFGLIVLVASGLAAFFANPPVLFTLFGLAAVVYFGRN